MVEQKLGMSLFNMVLNFASGDENPTDSSLCCLELPVGSHKLSLAVDVPILMLC